MSYTEALKVPFYHQTHRISGSFIFILSIYNQFKEEFAVNSTTFETGTIRQVHRHLTSTGYNVSEYAIRRWVKLGIIPAAFSGRTAYINVANVQRVLESGTRMPTAH